MTATIPRRRRNVWAGHNIDAATAAHTSEGEAASARLKRENAPLAAKQAADLARDFRDEFGFDSGSCDAAGNFNEAPACCPACRAAWVETAAHRACPNA